MGSVNEIRILESGSEAACIARAVTRWAVQTAAMSRRRREGE